MPGRSGPQIVSGFKKVKDFLGLFLGDDKFEHIGAGPLVVFVQPLLELVRGSA
jgi:hypothetical protein